MAESTPEFNAPSFEYLERHQRNVDEYRKNVLESVESRYGPAWWGAWAQHVGLPQDGSIIDLGMGTGYLLEQLRERYPEANLTGVELHPKLLEIGRPAAERCNAKVVKADLGIPVPIEDSTADVVVSALTFHELPYPPALLENASRLLRSGGTLVLFDIVKWPLEVYLGTKGPAPKEVSPDTIDHFREHCLFTADDLVCLVEYAGLSVVEVVGRSNGKFAMVFATKP
jgi:SAM-dependent methyltransferase